MSKGRKRRKRGTGLPGVVPGRQATADVVEAAGPGRGAEVLAEEAAEIGRYISGHNTRTAVKQAKKIHARVASDASESLLMSAYAARIKAMQAGGLVMEANELTALVAGRFPAAWRRHRQTRAAEDAHRGTLAALVAPLGDADLAPERRAEIEDRVGREVTDLHALADCGSLPDDHPLRRAAAALAAAMTAVTSGPVGEGDIALDEVSRRSPLAPWKLLVRAIACFYRGDAGACARHLDAMEARSAACRLAGALRVMTGQACDEPLSAASEALVAHVTHRPDALLRRTLEELDGVLSSRRVRGVNGPIRRAIGACGKVRPDLLDALKQRISIRCMLADVPVDAVIRAMGGPSPHDAGFWRLLAVAIESEGQVDHACALWAEFVRHAANEGWFAPASVEAAAVHLHMARLLRSVPPRVLAEMQHMHKTEYGGMGHYYKGQPDHVRAAAPKPGAPDIYFIYPAQLYRRACEADPEAYTDWLAFAAADGEDHRLADDVAERWHAARPTDARPLLHLAESAEHRKAFTKALKYIDRAEALDTLDPSVKRARLRLWTRKALAHLKDGKTHLAEKDFAEIEAMPMSRDGERPAFLAAMRWINADRAGDTEAAEARRADLDALMGGPLDGAVLINCIRAGRSARKTGSRYVRRDPDRPPLPKDGNLPRAVARTCAIGEELAVAMSFPPHFRRRMSDQMPDMPPDVPPSHLRALGEAACRLGEMPLCYQISAAGLVLGPEHEARFLFLRARCLPTWGYSDRREDCFAAAAELARRRRQMDLLGEIVDAQHKEDVWLFEARPQAERRVDDETTAAILDAERTMKSTPAQPYGPRQTDRRYGEPLPAREGDDVEEAFAASLFDSIFEDAPDDDEWDDELDDDEDDFEIGPGILPGGAAMLEVLEALEAETGGRPPTHAEFMRVIHKHPALEKRLLAALLGAGGGVPNDMLDALAGGGGKSTTRKDRRRKRKRDRKNRRH